MGCFVNSEIVWKRNTFETRVISKYSEMYLAGEHKWVIYIWLLFCFVLFEYFPKEKHYDKTNSFNYFMLHIDLPGTISCHLVLLENFSASEFLFWFFLLLSFGLFLCLMEYHSVCLVLWEKRILKIYLCIWKREQEHANKNMQKGQREKENPQEDILLSAEPNTAQSLPGSQVHDLS